jgi:hypothetical protein
MAPDSLCVHCCSADTPTPPCCQALEALRKLKLEKAQEAKELRLKLATLKVHKDSASRLREAAAEGQGKVDNLGREIERLNRAIEVRGAGHDGWCGMVGCCVKYGCPRSWHRVLLHPLLPCEWGPGCTSTTVSHTPGTTSTGSHIQPPPPRLATNPNITTTTHNHNRQPPLPFPPGTHRRSRPAWPPSRPSSTASRT